MRRLHYHRADVFTDRAFGGNQLLVFMDAEGLSADMMQTMAREMNLPEITFVAPPKNADNDFHVRIFTPKMELPMAGHPTLGTAYILQREGKIPSMGTIRFEEGVGVIPVTLEANGDSPLITMTQPLPQFGAILEDRRAIADMLSLNETDLHPDYPVQGVSTGTPFTLILVRSLEAIRRINIRVDVWERILKDDDYPHIFTFTSETEIAGSTVHSRMFAPAMGIPEDPATGAASGPLGAYLVKYGIVKSENAGEIVSEQGIEMNRPSFIRIAIEMEGESFTSVKISGTRVYMGAGYLEVSS
jgi:trans-2,3-dihydro-3-hydroxyanthranilate isomerase